MTLKGEFYATVYNLELRKLALLPVQQLSRDCQL